MGLADTNMRGHENSNISADIMYYKQVIPDQYKILGANANRY